LFLWFKRVFVERTSKNGNSFSGTHRSTLWQNQCVSVLWNFVLFVSQRIWIKLTPFHFCTWS
jgi:hypothetical protein